jgi:hypothetical protein
VIRLGPRRITGEQPDHDSASVAEGRTCPSARCQEGAILLGIAGTNGVVGYLSQRLEVDRDFVTKAREGRSPERRFRFAGPCVEGDCAQWDGKRCGVIDMAVDAQQNGVVPTLDLPLPRCAIRATCRWFSQLGPKACAVCPLIVTDNRQSTRANTSESQPEGPPALFIEAKGPTYSAEIGPEEALA